MPETNEEMTAQEAADFLGMSRASLYLLRKSGELLPIEITSALKKPRLFYRRSDIEAYKKKMLGYRPEQQARMIAETQAPYSPR